MSNVNEEIGLRIAEIRKLRNKKQSDLADAVGVTAAAIGNYERGQRIIPADKVRKIANELNVPTWLITDGVPRNSQGLGLKFFADASPDDMRTFYEVESFENQSEAEAELDELRAYVNGLLKAFASLGEEKKVRQIYDYAQLIQREYEYSYDAGYLESDMVQNALKNAGIGKNSNPLSMYKQSRNQASGLYLYFNDDTFSSLAKIANQLNKGESIDGAKAAEVITNSMKDLWDRLNRD